MIRTLLKPLSFIPAILLMMMIYQFSAQPAEQRLCRGVRRHHRDRRGRRLSDDGADDAGGQRPVYADELRPQPASGPRHLSGPATVSGL